MTDVTQTDESSAKTKLRSTRWPVELLERVEVFRDRYQREWSTSISVSRALILLVRIGLGERAAPMWSGVPEDLLLHWREIAPVTSCGAASDRLTTVAEKATCPDCRRRIRFLRHQREIQHGD